MVKHLPTMRETWVQSLGWEDLPEKVMATHSSTLAWKIPWTEEPGGLQSMGLQSQTWLSKFTSLSVYSCHFLISSASVSFIPFLSFIVPVFVWNVPLVSLIFLKRPLVFPILLFSSICTDHWGRFSYLSLLFFGTLHSNDYIFPFLFCFLLLFFSQLFVRLPQTTISSVCIYFSWGWFLSLSPVQCHVLCP